MSGTDVSIVEATEPLSFGWRWEVRVNIDDPVAGFITMITSGWRLTERAAARSAASFVKRERSR